MKNYGYPSYGGGYGGYYDGGNSFLAGLTGFALGTAVGSLATPSYPIVQQYPTYPTYAPVGYSSPFGPQYFQSYYPGVEWLVEGLAAGNPYVFPYRPSRFGAFGPGDLIYYGGSWVPINSYQFVPRRAWQYSGGNYLPYDW